MRRSGSFARQVLRVRVGLRRPNQRGNSPLVSHPQPVVHPLPEVLPASSDVPTLAELRSIAEATPTPEPAPADSSLLPGAHTMSRRISFALVNACTLASIFLGLSAVFLAMRDDVRAAALCLIACVLFDGLDGALARKLGVSSPFGAQMDSLADMCSFGLAAPIVVYASLAGSVPTVAAATACALVAGCAAIRLARFNVSPKDGRFFCGVPTTMAAAVLAIAVLIGLPIPGEFQLAGVALLAVAMVSSFPYAKLARLLTLPPWLVLIPAAGALVNPRLTFAVVVAAYLLSGPLLWLHQRRNVQRVA
nr:CDP-alcohol phosphatidyltransferase family protein [Catenuloplanes atrovinosus]